MKCGCRRPKVTSTRCPIQMIIMFVYVTLRHLFLWSGYKVITWPISRDLGGRLVTVLFEFTKTRRDKYLDIYCRDAWCRILNIVNVSLCRTFFYNLRGTTSNFHFIYCRNTRRPSGGYNKCVPQFLAASYPFPELSLRPPQKSKQNSDNWCISSTNYPPSAPLSNWSFLYFTIFALFPFSFGYLSSLFRTGQWVGSSLIIWSWFSTRSHPKSLSEFLANYPMEERRFFRVIDWSKNYFLFLRKPQPTV